MAKAIQRTVIASSLLTHKLLGLNYDLVEHTTLNEKLDIRAGETSSDGTVPKMLIWCIGDGGHNFKPGSDAVPYVTPIQHRPSDLGLFNQIPAVLRVPSDDLPQSLRDLFALRRTEVRNGTNYIAYYGYRLDLTNVVVSMQKVVIQGGVRTVTAFTPNAGNLSPQPPVISSVVPTTTDGEYLQVTAPITIKFTEFLATELMKVAKILYGTEERAVVSEIALCTGINKPVPGTSTTGPITFLESIMTQVYTHITAYYAIGFSNQGFEFTIDLGHTEPLPAEGGISPTAP